MHDCRALSVTSVKAKAMWSQGNVTPHHHHDATVSPCTKLSTEVPADTADTAEHQNPLQIFCPVPVSEPSQEYPSLHPKVFTDSKKYHYQPPLVMGVVLIVTNA